MKSILKPWGSLCLLLLLAFSLQAQDKKATVDTDMNPSKAQAQIKEMEAMMKALPQDHAEHQKAASYRTALLTYLENLKLEDIQDQAWAKENLSEEQYQAWKTLQVKRFEAPKND